MTSRQFLQSALAAGACVTIVAAVAAGETLRVKTGLWEVTTTTQTTGMPPMDMSKLTPEQREKVEAMLKNRAQAAPRTTTKQECLTQQKLEQKLFDDEKQSAFCKRTAVTETASLQEFKLECGQPGREEHGVGSLRIEALNPESVKGTIKMAMAGGANAMNMNSTFTAKWLNASCGDVK